MSAVAIEQAKCDSLHARLAVFESSLFLDTRYVTLFSYLTPVLT
jgi:hypothetical protein